MIFPRNQLFLGILGLQAEIPRAYRYYPHARGIEGFHVRRVAHSVAHYGILACRQALKNAETRS